MSSPKFPKRRSLKECERGAIMVAGLFMTLFLVAMLYALFGLGRTIVMREGMQDAADAAAFSAAIFHARGMNLIVFINLVMAMLVAILIAIRLAQSLLIMLAFAATAGAFFSGGSTLALAAPATSGAASLNKVFHSAKRVIFPMLTGLHKTQEAVSMVVPWAAMADGMLEAASHHPAAKGAFALPGAISLPVEPDKFPVLCAQGSKVAAEIAVRSAFVLTPLPFEPPSFLLNPITKGAEALGKSTSAFLCGDGKGSPPKHTQSVESQFPKPEGLNICETDPGSRKCAEVEREIQQSIPRAGSGKCQQHCDYDGPYERQARKARAECQPAANRKFKSFTWQQRKVVASFRFEGGQWTETERRTSAHRLYTKKTPPCGEGGSMSEEWLLSSGSRSAAEPEALCSSLDLGVSRGNSGGTSIREEFIEVSRIFSCAREVKQELPLASKDEALGGAKSKKRTPHKIEDKLELGDDAFQIRAVAFGESPGPGKARKGVRLADRGKAREYQRAEASDDGTEAEAGAELQALAGKLGSLSVAQAEYYFDHAGDIQRSEWMWNMFWTARLKHFRLSSKKALKKEKSRGKKNATRTESKRRAHGTSKAKTSNQDACKKSGKKNCQGMNSAFDLFDGVVRH